MDDPSGGAAVTAWSEFEGWCATHGVNVAELPDDDQVRALIHRWAGPNIGPLPADPESTAAPWWHYPEKDAWGEFERERPDVAKQIKDVLPHHDLQRGPNRSPDPVLSSGVQIQGLWLRLAELLGYVHLERTP
jgi:hypothetical protein